MNRYLKALTVALGFGILLILAVIGMACYILGDHHNTKPKTKTNMKDTLQFQINTHHTLEMQQ